MSTLRFGWHMPSFPVDGSSGPRFVEQVRASLDRLHPHFESVWVDDHLWPWASWQPADTPFLECVSTIAHFATVYRDLTFGSFVFCQSYRTPAVLAKTAANLQLLTGGRYVFGIGAGWVEREYHAYDYEFPKPAVRIAQLDEAVQIVRKLWTEAPATFHGSHEIRVDDESQTDQVAGRGKTSSASTSSSAYSRAARTSASTTSYSSQISFRVAPPARLPIIIQCTGTRVPRTTGFP